MRVANAIEHAIVSSQPAPPAARMAYSAKEPLTLCMNKFDGRRKTHVTL